MGAMRALGGQAGRFALVGVVNTLVDYLLFNGLVYLAGLGVVPANILSGCAAILVSFLLNRNWTFPESKDHGAAHLQFGKHLVTTGVGLLLATVTVWLADTQRRQAVTSLVKHWTFGSEGSLTESWLSIAASSIM